MNARDARGEPDVAMRAKSQPGAGTAEGEALARAERAFALGDFAEVRRLARPLFTAEPPEVAEAARALHRRVSADPAQIAVIVGCLVVLATIVARYVL